MPFSGSRPACDARPWTTTSNVPVPLRPVFNAPPSALGSSTSTVPQATAPAPRSAPASCPEPTSSSAVNSISTPDASSSAATAWTAWTMPAFMSNTPGPGGAAVGDGERPIGERADREHRVVMTEEQHLAARRRPTSARADRPAPRRPLRRVRCAPRSAPPGCRPTSPAHRDRATAIRRRPDAADRPGASRVLPRRHRTARGSHGLAARDRRRAARASGRSPTRSVSGPHLRTSHPPAAASGGGNGRPSDQPRSVGPLARSSSRRAWASARPGIVPAGTHQSTVASSGNRSNHSRRRRR